MASRESAPRRFRPSAIYHLPFAILLLLLPGCHKSFKNANDDLRAERRQLQQRVAQLEADLQQRLGEVESLRAQLAGAGQAPAGAEEPVFSVVKLDRYTGPVDADGDGRDDVLRVYVKTLDQRGRMMPVAARAVVQAVHIAPDAEPTLYAQETWEPPAFDAAYRSGLTGTHYSFELSLGGDAPDELTVKVTITGTDGVERTAQQAYRIAR